MIYVLIIGILVGAVGHRLYVKHCDPDDSFHIWFRDGDEHISDLNAFGGTFDNFDDTDGHLDIEKALADDERGDDDGFGEVEEEQRIFGRI